MTPPQIDDRYIEVAASSGPEKDREEQGWTIVKDRATGRALVICANHREGALWVIRALNAFDRTEDRMSEDAA